MPSCPPGTVQVGIISVKGPDGEEGCVICEDCQPPEECLEYGWLFLLGEATGYCFQSDFNQPDTCCPGSAVTNTMVQYVGEWTSGPVPTLDYVIQSGWAGYTGDTAEVELSLGQTASTSVQAATASGYAFRTIGGFAWGANATGDGTGCTQPFVNCGAVNVGGCTSTSSIELISWTKPDSCDCSDLDTTTPAGRIACYLRCR